MRNKRTIGVVILAISLFVVFSAGFYRYAHISEQSADMYATPLKLAPNNEEPLRYLSSEYMLMSGFSSHLPLLIIDTGGIEPPITHRTNEEEIMVPIEGIESYVTGKFMIIDGNERNTPNDHPSTESRIMLKRRGNSSMLYEKPQYLMKLVAETGTEISQSLLGMEAESEWVLNGSMTDKSHMRNYLAYRTASKILPYTPESRYCEVLLKKGNGYAYQGLYLLTESIKQGVGRVGISQYQTSKPYGSYLIRRDRYDATKIMLDTFATTNELSHGYLGLIYPRKNEITDDMLQYIQEDVSALEKSLYADNSQRFSTYTSQMDTESFIDYFLVNEFFANYDAGNNSTYFYKKIGGKLCAGPVWDFDGAIDNFNLQPLNMEVMAFHTAPWFDRLVLDSSFVGKLEKRYSDLRRGVLSEENIMRSIDEIERHIDGAKEREWARWAFIYLSEHNAYALRPYVDEQGDLIRRETIKHEQEIYRMKTVLRRHGKAISQRLALLHEEAIWRTGWPERRDLLLIVVLASFLFSAVYVTRR